MTFLVTFDKVALHVPHSGSQKNLEMLVFVIRGDERTNQSKVIKFQLDLFFI